MCIICLDELCDEEALASARSCGYCEKHICAACMPQLTEITQDGEADEDNGDLRCPNCRSSLFEGDLHKRRKAIARCAPSVSEQRIRDLVTLEDLLARCMQLCAQVHADAVSYYSVEEDVVAMAIARDPVYEAMLMRVLGSSRQARSVRLALRKNPTDKANVTMLCREYVTLLTKEAGVGTAHAKRILEEVGRQSLHNQCDSASYLAVWESRDSGDRSPPDRGSAESSTRTATSEQAGKRPPVDSASRARRVRPK